MSYLVALTVLQDQESCLDFLHHRSYPIFMIACQQLDDDALVESGDMNSNSDQAAESHQEQAVEGILDSPEVTNRRTMLMEKIHELASHTAHGKRSWTDIVSACRVWCFFPLFKHRTDIG